MFEKRDVGVVLSGGGVNGVLMELGFLKRLRESVLWPRIAAIFGTSSGALSGTLAALDRLDDLEAFLMQLQPEQAFRPNRLWRLPFLGLHDYSLPATIDAWFDDTVQLARDVAASPVELVVIATDLTDDHAREDEEYELHYSSRTTPPAELAQAILASAAVSALVLPMRVGDRIATDGGWVRNFPLGVAYEHPDVELIAAFRYLPQYPKLGVGALEPLRRRLRRVGRIAPVRAFLAEIDDAEARAARGEPAHLADTIVRLARVSILRNTRQEERVAALTDQSLRELRSLRHDVLAQIDDPATRAAIAERFASARFPFRHDRLIPRIVVRGNVEGVGLDPGFRTQPRWPDAEKRLLIDRGYELADRELAAISPTLDDSGT
ncbi:MAG TPA: patatin-like phospholipase family protein [Gaiellaceae bacterium]|nr:patatin-like phospholipase family protein [Gaiellaceae bacterium]